MIEHLTICAARAHKLKPETRNRRYSPPRKRLNDRNIPSGIDLLGAASEGLLPLEITPPECTSQDSLGTSDSGRSIE
jgi:hypothetical protein